MNSTSFRVIRFALNTLQFKTYSVFGLETIVCHWNANRCLSKLLYPNKPVKEMEHSAELSRKLLAMVKFVAEDSVSYIHLVYI